MDISGIISISGRPGLFKVIAQGKNSIIVESLIDKKRFPAYSSDRISALDDISIYTYEDDVPLKKIFEDIYKKQEGKEAPSHKEDITSLQAFLSDILPDYDDERVYPSDIKKLFQWYNILNKLKLLKPSKVTDSKDADKKPKLGAAEIKDVKAKGPSAKAKAKSTTIKSTPKASSDTKSKVPIKKNTTTNK